MEYTEEQFEWKVPSHYSDPFFNLSVYKAAPEMYEALKKIGLHIAVSYDNNMKPTFTVDSEYLNNVKHILAKLNKEIKDLRGK